jgi:hypothetical protein
MTFCPVGGQRNNGMQDVNVGGLLTAFFVADAIVLAVVVTLVVRHRRRR